MHQIFVLYLVPFCVTGCRGINLRINDQKSFFTVAYWKETAEFNAINRFLRTKSDCSCSGTEPGFLWGFGAKFSAMFYESQYILEGGKKTSCWFEWLLKARRTFSNSSLKWYLKCLSGCSCQRHCDHVFAFQYAFAQCVYLICVAAHECWHWRKTVWGVEHMWGGEI